MLTTAQKAKYIHALVSRAERSAHQCYSDDQIKQAGLIAMREAWDNEHDDEIGLSRNPYTYQSECAAKRVLEAYDAWHDLIEVLDFANDHFLSMIKEEV